jgi:hypothetical protein
MVALTLIFLAFSLLIKSHYFLHFGFSTTSKDIIILGEIKKSSIYGSVILHLRERIIHNANMILRMNQDHHLVIQPIKFIGKVSSENEMFKEQEFFHEFTSEGFMMLFKQNMEHEFDSGLLEIYHVPLLASSAKVLPAMFALDLKDLVFFELSNIPFRAGNEQTNPIVDDKKKVPSCCIM